MNITPTDPIVTFCGNCGAKLCNYPTATPPLCKCRINGSPMSEAPHVCLFIGLHCEACDPGQTWYEPPYTARLYD